MSSIDLSDYKNARRKMRKFGVGVIPILAFSRYRNRALHYIFIGKSPEIIVKLFQVFGVPWVRIGDDKLSRGYYYAKIVGGDAQKVTDILLGKYPFANYLWARTLGVGND